MDECFDFPKCYVMALTSVKNKAKGGRGSQVKKTKRTLKRKKLKEKKTRACNLGTIKENFCRAGS